MSVFMQREIERLKRQVLGLSAVVEENVQLAGRALRERNPELAHEAERRDAEVDEKEMDVEEECLKILALHQPVAVDLRYVISVLKINNDLERIGDQAVNLAHKAIFLSGQPPVPIQVDFESMIARARTMLQRALDSLIQMDADLARDVCRLDDEVDAMKKTIRKTVLDALETRPEHARSLVAVMGAARNLERIADLATNIAEDVVYMIEGEIIRHGFEQPFS